MEIIFIRHTSVDVPAGTCYGQTDVPLRPTFPQEAETVKCRLAPLRPFDKVFTSPLSRCTRLADYCGERSAQRDARLLEIDFGLWEMKSYEDVRGPEAEAWFRDYFNTPAPSGESFRQQQARVTAFIDGLLLQKLRRVAVFTHGGVIACARLYAHEIDPNDIFGHIPPYGGIYRLTL